MRSTPGVADQLVSRLPLRVHLGLHLSCIVLQVDDGHTISHADAGHCNETSAVGQKGSEAHAYHRHSYAEDNMRERSISCRLTAYAFRRFSASRARSSSPLFSASSARRYHSSCRTRMGADFSTPQSCCLLGTHHSVKMRDASGQYSARRAAHRCLLRLAVLYIQLLLRRHHLMHQGITDVRIADAIHSLTCTVLPLQVLHERVLTQTLPVQMLAAS
jgi:hypothetical protein